MKSIFENIKPHLLFIILIIISGSIMTYFSIYNEIAEGGLDNYWHYFFSKYAPQYPDFFLHHWGKPVFILLSTSFAQFGFIGIKVFNILCGLIATIYCYKILILLKIPFKWTILPLLIFSPLYFIVLQSALTEPLFSLILIATIYFYFTEKFFLGSILISFILFSRSEGTFIIPCFLVYLMIIKQWKYIPLLFTGFIVYGIVGKLMGHDFLWFFTENPYQLKSPYGHGHFMDILARYDAIWGLPFLIVLCVSVSIMIFLFIKHKQFLFWKPINETGKIFFLVFTPSFIYLVFHLYVWHFGLCGSAGLERVLASVFPGFALLSIWSINKLMLSRFPRLLSLSFILIFFYFHIQTPFQKLSYPLKSWGAERCIIDATTWIKSSLPENCMIYYAYPNIIFELDRNPFDKSHNNELFAFKEHCKSNSISIPSFVFWDSNYSESTCGVSIKDLEDCHYTFVKDFTDGGDFHLKIYKRDH